MDSMRKELTLRSENRCELCGSEVGVQEYVVSPRKGDTLDEVIAVCAACNSQLTGQSEIAADHWRCLNDSIWSEVPGVKVVAYRILHKLRGEGWPVELLDMMYIADDELSWAKEEIEEENAIKHIDSNGVQLINGDTITLVKDLDVKGAGFTAKRGTAVRNIRLVHDDSELIEGKVNGQSIYILTKFVKK